MAPRALVRANDGVLPASARASDAADGCDAKAALVLAPRDDAKRLEEERRLFPRRDHARARVVCGHARDARIGGRRRGAAVAVLKGPAGGVRAPRDRFF